MRAWPKCSGPARLSPKFWQERLSVSYRINQARGKPRVLTFDPIACVLSSNRHVTEGSRNRIGGGTPGPLHLYGAPLGPNGPEI